MKIIHSDDPRIMKAQYEAKEILELKEQQNRLYDRQAMIDGELLELAESRGTLTSRVNVANLILDEMYHVIPRKYNMNKIKALVVRTLEQCMDEEVIIDIPSMDIKVNKYYIKYYFKYVVVASFYFQSEKIYISITLTEDLIDSITERLTRRWRN